MTYAIQNPGPTVSNKAGLFHSYEPHYTGWFPDLAIGSLTMGPFFAVFLMFFFSSALFSVENHQEFSILWVIEDEHWITSLPCCFTLWESSCQCKKVYLIIKWEEGKSNNMKVLGYHRQWLITDNYVWSTEFKSIWWNNVLYASGSYLEGTVQVWLWLILYGVKTLEIE